jgi:hypothetical protein
MTFCHCGDGGPLLHAVPVLYVFAETRRATVQVISTLIHRDLRCFRGLKNIPRRFSDLSTALPPAFHQGQHGVESDPL